MGVRRLLALLGTAGAAVALAGCGGSARTSAPATGTGPAPSSTGPAAPLQPEPGSAATGDIPDNQVFLTFRNAAAGYSIKYPEGWAQRGSGRRLVFRDKNNIVRVVVLAGAAPTAARIRRDVAALA